MPDPKGQAAYRLTASPDLRRRTWTMLTALTTGYGLEGRLNPRALSDFEVAVARLEPEQASGRTTLRLDRQGLDEDDRLSFAMFPAPNGTGRLVALPLPWRTEDGEAVIDLSVTSQDLMIAVEDPDAGTLLGYLSSGSLTEAVVLARALAERFLYEKNRNPYAAAAAGFVLIADPAGRLDTPWRLWLANLSQRAAFLPDAAVLHGWNLLQRKGEGDIDQARLMFLEAFQRGVPVFSEGLRRLSAGLALFADDAAGRPDHEVRDALALVELVTVRAEAHQPLTTLRLGDAP